MSKFAKIIKKRRTTLGWSIRDLSRASGVSHSYLSRLENGIRPQPKNKAVFDAIMDALNSGEKK